MTTRGKNGGDRPVKYDPRPQRMCAWFAVVSLTEFASLDSEKIPFLDTFVTIEQTDSGYVVRFEGADETCRDRIDRRQRCLPSPLAMATT